MLLKWIPAHKRKERIREVVTTGSPAKQNEATIPPIDTSEIDKIRTRMGARFGHILTTFIDSTTTLQSSINAGFAGNNTQQIADAAHAMKSCGQLGAKRLYLIALQLEDAARNNNKEDIQGLVVSMNKEIALVHAEIRKLQN